MLQKIKLVHKIHQMKGGDTKTINIRPPQFAMRCYKENIMLVHEVHQLKCNGINAYKECIRPP